MRPKQTISKQENYLIPVDAKLDNENDVDYDCINVGRILAKMESSKTKTKTNIIILDATPASDGSGKNGLYTAALLSNIETPQITIMEMFQKVRSTVKSL